MPKCPNCGRETARTEDWACQWCGYPLLSESYKKIPKTFKQLKEERLHKVESETELAAEQEERAKKEAERQAREEAKKKAKEAREQARPEEKAWKEAEHLPKEKARQELKEAEEKARQQEKARKEAKRLVKEKAGQEPELKVELEPELEVEQKPEPMVEPEPEPVAAIIELNVEELSSAFSADGAAAHEKFTNSTIKLTGNVDRIVVNDINNNYYITLASAEKKIGLRDVHCKFDKKHVPELKLLTEGETVTVQGKYAGYVIDINMRYCTLVR